jgi:hypothetical protein
MMLDVAKAVPLCSGGHVLLIVIECVCVVLYVALSCVACGHTRDTVMRGTQSSVLNAACVCLTSRAIHVERM